MSRILLFLCCVTLASRGYADTFDPTRYGAVADDDDSDTAAIQRAIDECSKSGNGIVLLEGGTFIAGSLKLKSGVTLKLAKDSELHCSLERNDIQRGVWISAEGAERVGISGPGKIVGKGSECFRIRFDSVFAWLKKGAKSGAVKHPVEVHGRLYTHMIQIVKCRDVTIEDVNLNDSQHWTVHVLDCKNVAISKVRIRNLPYGPYTDGIDIDSSSDVKVVDCDVTAGDDAYCVKTTGKRGVRSPATNITFERCIARSPTNGFKIGTETLYDISKVTFKDCKVTSAIPGIGPIGGLTITSVDGANVSHVTAKGIEMELVRCPIFIRLGNRNRGQTDPSKFGSMENVKISDINVKACTMPAIVSGIEDAPIRSLTLQNIHINRIGKGAARKPVSVPEHGKEYPEATMFGNLPARILFCRHARNVELVHLTANAVAAKDAGPAMTVVDCVALDGQVSEK